MVNYNYYKRAGLGDSMLTYYFQGWRRSFDFKGRATRKEYWWFVFWDFASLLILSVFPALKYASNYSLSLEEKIPSAIFLTELCDFLYSFFLGPVFFILFILSIIPRVAIGVRRLHDIGRSGWWLFLCLVPCGVGFLVLTFWMINPSKDDPDHSKLQSDLN